MFVSNTFAALKYPNYRLWFIGQLISVIGSWMQNTAQGYLVYELTGSPAYLGYVGFASGAPSWLLTLYGGVIADRISKRTMILIAQSGMMILAFILAGLVFLDLVQPWHIILLSFCLGITFAFDVPARQSFVAELVPKEDLSNAIALNSTMFNGAVVIGPAIAGMVYALVGPGWCFTINGITYIAIIVTLTLMKFNKPLATKPHTSAISEIKEGIHYAFANETIILLMIGLAFFALFAASIVTLIPAWAVNVLEGDVKINGLLLSARGVGALIGALMVASLSRQHIGGKLWTIGSLILPVIMIAFSFTRWLPLSLLAMIGVGWSFITIMNTSNAMVQLQIPDDMRGRVMSIYVLMFMGFMPLGSLTIGLMADKLSEPVTLLINASILLLYAIFIYFRKPEMRHLK